MVYVVSLASWRTRSGTRLAASLPSKTSLQESFDLAFASPCPCPSACPLPPLSLHPRLQLIPTAAILGLLGVRNGTVQLVCLFGSRFNRTMGLLALRSLQLFYVNYSLQPGVSFSWLSCTFLVSCFLDSRLCFSALCQLLTKLTNCVLDIINLYLDLTCLFISFVRSFVLSCLWRVLHSHLISNCLINTSAINLESFLESLFPQLRPHSKSIVWGPSACSGMLDFCLFMAGAPCPCCSALVSWLLGFSSASISCPSLSGVCRSHLSADNVPGRRTTHRF